MTWFMVGTLALAAALMVGRCGAAPVGLVDSQRVLNESVKGLQYQKQLDDREKQMVAELNAVAPQVSKADLSARRARYMTELGQMKRDFEAQLNQAAAEVAKQDPLRFVLLRAPVWSGGQDVTQQVIDRLK